jgi:hypothetical protein
LRFSFGFFSLGGLLLQAFLYFNVTLSHFDERPAVDILCSGILFVIWVVLFSLELFFVVKDFLNLGFGEL